MLFVGYLLSHMLIKETLAISIDPPPIHYELVFGSHLVEEAIDFSKTLAPKTFVVTTDAIQDILPSFKGEKMILPSGESIKSRAIKEKIENSLIARGIGKTCSLVAIGGGALLDLVGFTAATYCRGVSFISVPTTLLAMTDASIGGKTGVNVEEAKNWIGTFYHPRKIFIDLNFLTSLPEKEYINGLCETIKHSLVADKEFFEFLEENIEKILQKDPVILMKMIHRSISIKKSVIEIDPFEKKGFRRILNFGHTIGHALETFSNYNIAHGEAIFMGILVESTIAFNLGYLCLSDLKRIKHLLKKLPLHLNFPLDLPLEILKRDKKGPNRFVILTGIGSVGRFDEKYVTELAESEIKKGWDDAMCDH